MRRHAGRWYGLGFWLALIMLLVIGAGCGTARQPLFTSTSGPGWRVQQGQALWRPNRRMPELAGEVVMARHEEGCCSLEFAKTPFALVRAQTTPTNWFIRFPAGHIGFRGHRPTPARFAWLHLPAALAGEPLPPTLRFERKADGSWRLANTRSGETIEGFLAP